MPLMTYSQQVSDHLRFIRSNGLDVESLTFDALIRCHAISSEERGRGEYAYITHKNPMDKPGWVGLVTWCRGLGGTEANHMTYGLDGEVVDDPAEKPIIKKAETAKSNSSEDVARKARYLWDRAKTSGQSDYLDRKGVGSYGIRFLENEYGRVAVIPAKDVAGTLRTLQFLNPDGVKRFMTGSAGAGLFHKLREPVNGQSIGIAESYATSALCMELVGVPVVCAFSSGNLKNVALTLRNIYPASPLFVFADNDRHHEAKGQRNQGVLKAHEACDAVGSMAVLAIPDFGDLAPSKDVSDWNDLVRLRGKSAAIEQIHKAHIKKTGNADNASKKESLILY